VTAAWDRFLATGSGQLQFRLQIEGFPYEPVSSRAMESTATDGRIRYAGLDSSRIKLKETVDLVRAKWEPQGFRVELVDRAARWTEALKKPTAVTYLDATSVTAAATTVNVKATGQFAATGKVWINTEVMSYSGKTGTSFTGLTRGVYETLAQKHYTIDGERARRPEVTNWPRVREGRRVALYVYASGDDLDSTSPTAGTKIWTGVVSTEPAFDGMSWSFSVDPITRKWDADVGNDLEDPAGIRGVYYPAVAPLLIQAWEWDAASVSLATTTPLFDQFAIAGFWETQEAFVDNLTTQMASQFAAFTQTLEAVVVGGTWGIEFQTPAAPNHFMMAVRVQSAVDSIDHTLAPIDVDSGSPVYAVGADGRFRFTQTKGRVPRAIIGSWIPSGGADLTTLDDTRRIGLDPDTFPASRVYIGGHVGVTANIKGAAVEWESNNGDAGALRESFTVDVASTDIDTTNRYIDLIGIRPIRSEAGATKHYAAIGPDVVEIRFGRGYGTGHLGDFLTNLTNDTSASLNTGSVPDIQAADFASTGGGISIASTDILDAATSNPLAQDRTYSVFSPVSFGELVEQECRLLGVFPAYNASGEVTFRQSRLVSAAEVVSKTLTTATIITGDGEWLSYEHSPLGQFNTVEFSTGYDPVEDEYTGSTQRVRDLASWAQNPDGRVVQIQPKSMDSNSGFSYQDLVQQFGRILGTFGGSHAYLTVRVSFQLFSVLVGDAVKITWPKVPNSDGTLGVTNKGGFVVAREWDFKAASGKLTIMVTDQNVAGYVPESKISSIVGSSGTTGPFTANGDTTYFPGATTAADHWSSGDKVRLFRYDDSSTATNETAVLNADPIGNSFNFTTDSNWTHAGSTWVLGSRVSTAITAASQKIYAFVGNADATLDFSGDTGNNVQTLGP